MYNHVLKISVWNLKADNVIVYIITEDVVEGMNSAKRSDYYFPPITMGMQTAGLTVSHDNRNVGVAELQRITGRRTVLTTDL